MMNEMQQKESRPVCRVAILRTHDDPVHEAISIQLFRRLSPSGGESSKYQPVIFQASYNKDVVFAQLEKVVRQGCRLLVSVGQGLGNIVKEIYGESGEFIPTLYTGIIHPVESGFADSLEKCGGNRAVISAVEPDSMAISKGISRLKQSKLSILLPYCDHGIVGNTKARAYFLKECLEKEGFEVITHAIASKADFIDVVVNNLKSIGLVISLEGGCSTAASELIFLCWRNKIIFCSGYGKQALERGAPCAYGGDYVLLTDDIYEIIELFSEYGVSLGDMPVKISKYERHFMVNEPLMLQMGVTQEVIEALRESDDVEIVYWWIDKPWC